MARIVFGNNFENCGVRVNKKPIEISNAKPSTIVIANFCSFFKINRINNPRPRQMTIKKIGKRKLATKKSMANSIF